MSYDERLRDLKAGYAQARQERDEARAEVVRLRAENALLRTERLPHMCRDGHPEVRHADSGEDERCPVCRERDRAEAAEAERDELRGFIVDHARRIAEQAIEIDRLRILAPDLPPVKQSVAAPEVRRTHSG